VRRVSGRQSCDHALPICIYPFIFLGAILTPLAGKSFVYLNIIWSLDNIGNAIMAVPNLIELIILAWTVAAITKERL